MEIQCQQIQLVSRFLVPLSQKGVAVGIISQPFKVSALWSKIRISNHLMQKSNIQRRYIVSIMSLSKKYLFWFNI